MTSKRTARFALHKKQGEAWIDLFRHRKRTVALISGVQGGKTIFGALALRKEIKENKHPNAAWIIGAPTYKIMQQSTLPTFKKVFGPLLGDYNKTEGCYALKDGRNIWFRTATDPDSVEGVPDCGAGGTLGAWIDEAGKCNRRFWVNVEARLARCQGQLLLTTTWYSLNWLYKSIWVPFSRGERTDIGITYFNSAENPTFPVEELERQRMILSRAEFSRKFLGEPSKPEGLIHSDFDSHNWCSPRAMDYQRIPTYMGLDYGFDHPMAMVIRAIPEDGNCYTVSIFKKSGLSMSQQLEAVLAKCKMFNVRAVYGGHDRPDFLLELNSHGIRAMKYFEGAPEHREVNVGNQLHSELIKTNRYQVFSGIEGAEDLEDEYMSYSWDRPEGEIGGEREKPVNINDDLMAAERYCTVGTYEMMKERKEEEPLYPARYAGRYDTWKPGDEDNEDRGWMDY